MLLDAPACFKLLTTQSPMFNGSAFAGRGYGLTAGAGCGWLLLAWAMRAEQIAELVKQFAEGGGERLLEGGALVLDVHPGEGRAGVVVGRFVLLVSHRSVPSPNLRYG